MSRRSPGLGDFFLMAVQGVAHAGHAAALSELFRGMPDTFVADCYAALNGAGLRAAGLDDAARQRFLEHLDRTFITVAQTRRFDPATRQDELVRLLDEHRRTRDAAWSAAALRRLPLGGGR